MACRRDGLLAVRDLLTVGAPAFARHPVGLDPTLGIFHTDQRDRASPANDAMEASRPAVDAYLLALLTQRTFSPRDFAETRRGACRILSTSPQPSPRRARRGAVRWPPSVSESRTPRATLTGVAPAPHPAHPEQLVVRVGPAQPRPDSAPAWGKRSHAPKHLPRLWRRATDPTPPLLRRVPDEAMERDRPPRTPKRSARPGSSARRTTRPRACLSPKWSPPLVFLSTTALSSDWASERRARDTGQA
jgi:hypothetical protein